MESDLNQINLWLNISIFRSLRRFHAFSPVLKLDACVGIRNDSHLSVPVPMSVCAILYPTFRIQN